MKRLTHFFKSVKFKVFSSCFGVMSAILCMSLSSFAAGETPTPIPATGTFDLSVLQQLWQQAAGMIIDTINIIASQPMLVMLCVAMPLVGLGIGLFSRIKNA